MANTRVLGRVAAVLFTLSGVAAAASLPATASPGMDRGGVLVVAFAAFAAGGAIWLIPWERWPRSTMIYTIVPAGLGLIAAGNYMDDSLSNRYTYGVFFVVLFAWIGVSQRPWTSVRVSPVAALAYMIPLILRGHAPAEIGSVVLTLPVCVIIGEALAWLSVRLARAEEAARKNETRLRLLASNIPGIVWTTDAASIITSSVGAGLAVYGLGQDELCGTSYYNALDASEPDAPPLVAHERALAGEPSSFEIEYRGRPYRTRIEPLRGSDGNVIGTIGFSLDITDEKQVEQALRDAYEQEREAVEGLRAVDRMKTSFMDAISHELRTPLSVLLGTSLTLEKQYPMIAEDVRARLLGGLATNARKLERLLVDLLDLDRLARGVIEPSRQTVDVVDVVRRSIQGVVPPGRWIDVVGDSAVADVDPGKVQRVVENLVANAFKHTPGGCRVWVRVLPEPNGVLITVDDEGPGIPDEIKESIFEPFRRANFRSHAPGTGIGLSLVARFAEIHGGRAWVEDRPGGGASFRVFLPSSGEPDLQIASRSSPPARRPPRH